MRRTATLVSGVLAGICAATALVLPAVAGGIDHGPVVKHRVPAAVPVPAPIPVPDTASNWYVRLDAAYSLSDVDKYNAEAPFNDDAVRSDQGLDQFGRYGLGVGYHFSRWLRGDVTLDLRSEVKSRAVGTIVTPTATGSLRDSYFDQFRSKNWTGLANLYYDLAGWRSFTPYIGAGLGFAVHTSDGRTLNRSTVTCSLTNVCTTGVVVQGSGARQSDIALAAAFMTGVSWKVSDNGSLDVGYRLLHLQGTTFSTPMNTGGPAARVTIPDQNIHEIRVGYRLDIN